MKADNLKTIAVVAQFLFWLYVAWAYVALVLFESSLPAFPGSVIDFGAALAKHAAANGRELFVLFLTATAVGLAAVMFRRAGKKTEVLALKGYVLALGSMAAIHQFPSVSLGGEELFPFVVYFALFVLMGLGFYYVAAHHRVGGSFAAQRIGRLFVIFAMAGTIAIVFYYFSQYFQIARDFQFGF